MSFDVKTLSPRERQVYDIIAEKGPISVRDISIEMYGDAASIQGVRVWLHRLRKRGVEMEYRAGHVMLGACTHLAGYVCPLCNAPAVTIDTLGERIHRFAVAKGWWEYPEGQRVNRLLDWIIEEVEEARTAYNERGKELWVSVDAEGLAKPEGFGVELADIQGILSDLAIGTGQHLPYLLESKLAYNLIRKYRRDAEGVQVNEPV